MLIKTKKAIFFNKKGEYHGTKTIKKNDEVIKYGEKTYNFNPDNTRYRKTGPLFVTDYYFFNTENTDGLVIEGNPRINVLNPELYDIYLENNLARKLSETGKTGLMKVLAENPQIIIIGLVIVAVIIYFVSGGQLT